MFRKTSAGLMFGLSIIVFLGSLHASSAATMTTSTQTAAIAPTQTDWGPTTAALSGVNPLSFTKFDPSLGTLDSVNLALSYTYNHAVTMSFTSASTITVTGDQNGITMSLPNQTAVVSGPVPDYSATRSYAGPSYPYTLTLPTETTTGSLTPVKLTSAADLAMFTQSAPSDTLIKLPVSAQARSSFTSSSSNGGGGSQVYAGVVATLSYSYEPFKTVPEPSTFAAFALGLGGYLLARRNRKSASGR